MTKSEIIKSLARKQAQMVFADYSYLTYTVCKEQSLIITALDGTNQNPNKSSIHTPPRNSEPVREISSEIIY